MIYNSQNEQKTKQRDLQIIVIASTDRTVATILHLAVSIKKKITLNTEKKQLLIDKLFTFRHNITIEW